MLRKVVMSLIVCGLFLSLTTAAQAENKIALVDMQKALVEVKDGKKLQSEIEKEGKSQKAKFDKKREEIEKMGSELEKQQIVLSPEALQGKRKDLQAKIKTFQEEMVVAQREIQKNKFEKAKEIHDKLNRVVSHLAKENGYNLVIDNSARIVLVNDGANDITDEVISTYNKGKIK